MIATLIAAVAALSPAAAGTRRPDALAAYMRHTMPTSEYRVAYADLNGDGVKEAVVYMTDAAHCGSGGCDLLILQPTQGRFRQVMEASLARPPIRQLATRSHGWSDIGVLVAGGGVLPGHEARLRFNGRVYPSNPSLAPAEPATAARGRTLIAPAPPR